MTAGDHAGRQGWLVLGGLHHLNGAAPPEPADPIVLARLGEPADVGFPSNTVIVRWADLGEVELRGIAAGGGRSCCATVDGAALFDGMLPGAVLRGLVEQVCRDADGMRPIVPLSYLSVADATTAAAGPERTPAVHVHVHSQIRFLDEDACFVRVTPDPVRVAGVDTLGWLPEAVRRHADHALLLNNHQRYFQKCFPGRELEHKYTLQPPLDIWTLTVELYRRLRRGALPGFVMEYRDEFQAWDYRNHLFHIPSPEDERGYVSFIPTTDGRNLVKRKWFAADAFDRRESHTYGVHAEQGYEHYIREVLGVTTARRLPSFRRVRYDVNFESLRTGHVYGIFFDRSSLVEAPDVALYQCELEYLRSRTAVEPSEDDVLVEIEAVALWLEDYLREHDLEDRRGTYSKLSFLLDAVAARPELAGTA